MADPYGDNKDYRLNFSYWKFQEKKGEVKATEKTETQKSDVKPIPSTRRVRGRNSESEFNTGEKIRAGDEKDITEDAADKSRSPEDGLPKSGVVSKESGSVERLSELNQVKKIRIRRRTIECNPSQTEEEGSETRREKEEEKKKETDLIKKIRRRRRTIECNVCVPDTNNEQPEDKDKILKELKDIKRLRKIRRLEYNPHRNVENEKDGSSDQGCAILRELDQLKKIRNDRKNEGRSPETDKKKTESELNERKKELKEIKKIRRRSRQIEFDPKDLEESRVVPPKGKEDSKTKVPIAEKDTGAANRTKGSQDDSTTDAKLDTSPIEQENVHAKKPDHGTKVDLPSVDQRASSEAISKTNEEKKTKKHDKKKKRGINPVVEVKNSTERHLEGTERKGKGMVENQTERELTRTSKRDQAAELLDDLLSFEIYQDVVQSSEEIKTNTDLEKTEPYLDISSLYTQEIIDTLADEDKRTKEKAGQENMNLERSGSTYDIISTAELEMLNSLIAEENDTAARCSIKNQNDEIKAVQSAQEVAKETRSTQMGQNSADSPTTEEEETTSHPESKGRYEEEVRSAQKTVAEEKLVQFWQEQIVRENTMSKTDKETIAAGEGTKVNIKTTDRVLSKANKVSYQRKPEPAIEANSPKEVHSDVNRYQGPVLNLVKLFKEKEEKEPVDTHHAEIRKGKEIRNVTTSEQISPALSQRIRDLMNKQKDSCQRRADIQSCRTVLKSSVNAEKEPTSLKRVVRSTTQALKRRLVQVKSLQTLATKALQDAFPPTEVARMMKRVSSKKLWQRELFETHGDVRPKQSSTIRKGKATVESHQKRPKKDKLFFKRQMSDVPKNRDIFKSSTFEKIDVFEENKVRFEDNRQDQVSNDIFEDALCDLDGQSGLTKKQTEHHFGREGATLKFEDFLTEREKTATDSLHKEISLSREQTSMDIGVTRPCVPNKQMTSPMEKAEQIKKRNRKLDLIIGITIFLIYAISLAVYVFYDQLFPPPPPPPPEPEWYEFWKLIEILMPSTI